MEHNPYAAPRSEVLDFDVPSERPQLATRVQRLANLIVDSLTFFAFAVLLLVVSQLVDPAFAEAIAGDNQVFLLLLTLYYTLFEFFFGGTPGKLLTGTRVVTETGATPTFLQVLVRALVRLVPFEPLSCLGDPPIGWHDQWSRTRLVRTRPKPSLGPDYDLRRSGRRPPGAWHAES